MKNDELISHIVISLPRQLFHWSDFLLTNLLNQQLLKDWRSDHYKKKCLIIKLISENHSFKNCPLYLPTQHAIQHLSRNEFRWLPVFRIFENSMLRTEKVLHWEWWSRIRERSGFRRMNQSRIISLPKEYGQNRKQWLRILQRSKILAADIAFSIKYGKRAIPRMK